MSFNHITVYSVDLTKSIYFYEKLGLKLIVKSLPYYAKFESPNGKSKFYVHQTDKLLKSEGVYLYFECEHLNTLCNELRENGIQFDQELSDQRLIWREAILRDLDGNQLILYCGEENW